MFIKLISLVFLEFPANKIDGHCSYLSSGMLLPVRSEPSEAIPSALMAI